MSSIISTFLRGRDQITNQVLALSGPASAAIFALTNIIFTICRADGYSCGKQMVSKLGALGAPYACVFNLFGFVLPGLLVVALAAGLKRELRVSAAPAFLGLCGVFLIVVGLFPVGFTLLGDFTHVTAALLCGFSFVVAALLLSGPMRKHPSFIKLGRLTPWLVFLLILNPAGQLAWAPQGLLPPGWTERLNLVGYFAWLTFAGLSFGQYRQPGYWPLSEGRSLLNFRSVSFLSGEWRVSIRTWSQSNFQRLHGRERERSVLWRTGASERPRSGISRSGPPHLAGAVLTPSPLS